MPKLTTTIEVDEDAIVRHLLAKVHAELHGPDFSVGDVVMLTDQVLPPAMPTDAYALHGMLAGGLDGPGFADMANAAQLPGHVREVMQAGTVGVVSAILPRDERPTDYEVLLVDAAGATFSIDLPAVAISKRAAS